MFTEAEIALAALVVSIVSAIGSLMAYRKSQDANRTQAKTAILNLTLAVTQQLLQWKLDAEIELSKRRPVPLAVSAAVSDTIHLLDRQLDIWTERYDLLAAAERLSPDDYARTERQINEVNHFLAKQRISLISILREIDEA